MAYTPIDKSDDYFNPVIYTGTGASLANTGVGFQPDFTWIKGRSGATEHVLTDSVRGVTIELSSNDTGADETVAQGLTAFGTDGFTVGTDGSYNTSSATYASWNWKAGGTAVSNTAGSITSSVSANTTAGFSIVSYTGTGAVATIGHGLGVVPAMIIVKVRSSAGDWSVYHTTLGNTKNLKLNTTAAEQTSINYWNNTSPDVDKFTVYNESNVNGSGQTYIAYCFAEVKGFSKFGSYTGNGSADGTFVYTGFKPAFVLVKNTQEAAAEWRIIDNKRSDAGGFNLIDKTLDSNNSDAELDAGSTWIVDFLSNGFKWRINTATVNAVGENHIYMAFAENPFVTSTGIPTPAR
jgi:hypothetical protein